MNNIKRFLNLLNDKTIEGKIIDCYCTLHKQAWYDGKIKTNIVLNLDGTITTTNTNEIKDNQLLLLAISEYVEVPEIEFGDIELQDDYQEFVDYLMEECEEIFESNVDKQQYIWDNATWSEYKYFNELGYEDEEQCVWNYICDMEDADFIYNVISKLISRLEMMI
jgi:hypothetical protein